MSSPARPASRFVRLARICNAHRWRTLGVWLLALIAIQVVASGVGTKQISSFRLPGTESQRAYDLLAKHFPSAKGDSDQLVFSARGQVTKDGRIGVATINYAKSTNDIKPTTLENVEKAAFTARSASLEVEHGGPGAEVVRFANSQGPSEFFGVLAAAIVLLITFGSAVAAGLPLLA